MDAGQGRSEPQDGAATAPKDPESLVMQEFSALPEALKRVLSLENASQREKNKFERRQVQLLARCMPRWQSCRTSSDEAAPAAPNRHRLSRKPGTFKSCTDDAMHTPDAPALIVAAIVESVTGFWTDCNAHREDQPRQPAHPLSSQRQPQVFLR
eukprot:3084067-Rhodomonas_salina.1